MKISNFFKTHFFSIVLTFVDDFTLNSDNNKEIWSFGLCWPLLAFLAFVALDDFLKQKLAFFDKNQAELTCFQQSDVKTNYQTRSGILKHCDMWVICGLDAKPLFLQVNMLKQLTKSLKKSLF